LDEGVGDVRVCFLFTAQDRDLPTFFRLEFPREIPSSFFSHQNFPLPQQEKKTTPMALHLPGGESVEASAALEKWTSALSSEVESRRIAFTTEFERINKMIAQAESGATLVLSGPLKAGAFHISVERPNGATRPVLDFVKREYEKIGFSVKVHYDPDDDDSCGFHFIRPSYEVTFTVIKHNPCRCVDCVGRDKRKRGDDDANDGGKKKRTSDDEGGPSQAVSTDACVPPCPDDV
jgi:hypothetical protein